MNLLAAPVCPSGHGRLRGYTIGSRLIVEVLLIGLLILLYTMLSSMAGGLASYGLAGIVIVTFLVGLAFLDYFVLSYRCSTCGSTFRRRELASRDPS